MYCTQHPVSHPHLHPSRSDLNSRMHKLKTLRQNQKMRTLKEVSNNCQSSNEAAKMPEAVNRVSKRPHGDDVIPESKRRKTEKAASEPQLRVKPIEILQEEKQNNKVTISNDYSFLTKPAAAYLIDYLGYLIEVEAYEVGYVSRPLFKGRPFYKNGCLHIWCENSQTVDWLYAVIDCINVRGEQNFVITKSNMSTDMVRCGVPIPDKTNPQTIKRVLRYQNLWAEPHRWTYHGERIQRCKTFLIVSIPEDVMEKIRERSNKLFYKLGTVNVLEEGPNGTFLNKSRIGNMAAENGAKNLGFSCFYSDDEEMVSLERDPILDNHGAVCGQKF